MGSNKMVGYYNDGEDCNTGESVQHDQNIISPEGATIMNASDKFKVNQMTAFFHDKALKLIWGIITPWPKYDQPKGGQQ